MPELVKVGKTTREPLARADELSGVTGIPTPFIVAFDRFFENCDEAEQYIHTVLSEKGYRVSENREFFKAPVKDVITTILQAPNPSGNIPSEGTEDEDLLTKNQNDELNDMKLSKCSPIHHPWTDLLNEAENYYHGHDKHLQDFSESLKLYKGAAKLGCIVAYRFIAHQYDSGEGVPKDKQKAFDFLKEGARKGDYFCFLEMARIFSGENNFNNFKKCVKKFFEARELKPDITIEKHGDFDSFIMFLSVADQNVKSGAIIAIAESEFKQKVEILQQIEKNESNPSVCEAILKIIDQTRKHSTLLPSRLIEITSKLETGDDSDLFSKNSKRNDKFKLNSDTTPAWVNILNKANNHYFGQVEHPKDFSKSIKLYKEAAKFGCIYAYKFIARQYYYAQGVPKDNQKALDFLKEGAERKGDYYCYLEIARIFLDENDHDKFKEWLDRFLFERFRKSRTVGIDLNMEKYGEGYSIILVGILLEVVKKKVSIKKWDGIRREEKEKVCNCIKGMQARLRADIAKKDQIAKLAGILMYEVNKEISTEIWKYKHEEREKVYSCIKEMQKKKDYGKALKEQITELDGLLSYVTNSL